MWEYLRHIWNDIQVILCVISCCYWPSPYSDAFMQITGLMMRRCISLQSTYRFDDTPPELRSDIHTRIYPNPIPSYTKVDKKENSVSTLSTWQCNSTYFFLFDKNSVTTDSSHNGFCLCSKTHHLILALQVQQGLADITFKKGCQTQAEQVMEKKEFLFFFFFKGENSDNWDCLCLLTLELILIQATYNSKRLNIKKMQESLK